MAMAATLALTAVPATAAGTAQIVLKRGRTVQARLNVELALSDREHEQGLMFRKSLTQNSGMLFLYDRAMRRAFWMKNTLIPLDMLFFDKSGELVFIYPEAEPESLAPIGPDDKVCAVLEIGGGEAERLGIQLGDRLDFKSPRTCE